MNYAEGFYPSANNEQFSISRSTIELALDDLLFNDDASNDDNLHMSWMEQLRRNWLQQLCSTTSFAEGQQQDVTMSTRAGAPALDCRYRQPKILRRLVRISSTSMGTLAADDENSMVSDDKDIDELSLAPSTEKKTFIFTNIPPLSQSIKDILPETVAPSRLSSIYGTRLSTPTSCPTLTLRAQSMSTHSYRLNATATSVNLVVLRGLTSALNSAPGGVKAECSNRGSTHTTLWRLGRLMNLTSLSAGSTGSSCILRILQIFGL